MDAVCAQGEDMVLNLELLSFCHVTISQPLKHERRNKKRLVPLLFQGGTASGASFLQPHSEKDKGGSKHFFSEMLWCVPVCVIYYVTRILVSLHGHHKIQGKSGPLLGPKNLSKDDMEA